MNARSLLTLVSVLSATTLVAVLGMGWHDGVLPGVLLKAYASASVLSFVAYAIDKESAVGRRRRLAERNLLLLDLVGGWPGGALAQQILRHKTSKPAYQWWFWLAVVVNCGALLAYWHLS